MTSDRSSSTQLARQALRELIGWPQKYAKEGAALGVRWPRGVLLHGPPGCGKTLAVREVAAECDAVIHTVTADKVVGAFTGQTERQLREEFQAAAEAASTGRRIVLFLDELDALCPRRSANRPHEARVAVQLLTLLDGAAPSAGLAIVAATNRPEAVEPALRRPGRLDWEVQLSPPDAQERAAILAQHSRALPLAADVDMASLAQRCIGYTGADLASLCRSAAMRALTSGSERQVEQMDFAAAMAGMVPSLTRGTEVELAPVSWSDIGGLADVKKRLRQAVEWPLKHAVSFKRLGLSPSRGVLLHGCCKTTLARAAAGATDATFLTLSGAQLHSMYVGAGEALLRDAFARARLAAPTIIFIDELDAVAARRGEGEEGGGDATVRLLSALLVEMDGLELASGVLVLAATNRRAAIDAALLRPGRLDVQLWVPPPDVAGRLQVLQIQTRDMPLAADVDLPALAEATELFTGAELEGLCREAALTALREDVHGAMEVKSRHFVAARAAMQPSLTPQLLRSYEQQG